ncbi:MAG TPA: glycoside hydrolase domain-containing protein, partial [Gemmatimonadales bacterium]|nr:glycoside hydrolase domain-containing protein [Gemmatimonadales bacterium]
VADSGAAVRVRIPWRRRDEQPEAKRIVIVAAATGVRVANVMAVAVNREYGDLVFEPTAGPGDYYVYYMPYQGTFRSNYPRITYRPPDSTAAPAWLARWRGAWAALPPATVSAFQAVDSMSGVWPMEVIATRAESESLAARHQGMHFLLFPEDRTRPIRMSADLPYWWIEAGANGPVTGSALRGEFYAFQIGVWAVDRALDSLTARFGDLAGPGAERIPATAFSSFNTGGVDWQGRTFTRWVQVGAGKVQALWCGVMVPDDQAPGDYEGRVTVSAAGLPPETLLVRLTVSPHAIAHHGDDEPWRLSRLRWLDSRLALDTGLVRPYTPVEVDGIRLSVLGREVRLAPSGLPARITSYFTEEMTAIGSRGREVLAAPVALVVEDSSGRVLSWKSSGLQVTHQQPGAAVWTAGSTAGPLSLAVTGELEFDGNVEYTLALVARTPTVVRDIRLEIPFARDVARYLMGMNRPGGAAPGSYDWTWDVKRNQDAAWVGDVNAGLQFTLKDDHYVRPLNTNFYQLRPLVLPRSWSNGGVGGCRFRAERAAYVARCYSGARTLAAGDTLYFNLRLLLTPFHPIDPRAQFTTRYFHAYKPIQDVLATGANVINVHHATAVNPYLNYPFLRPAEMRAYVDSAHAAGMRVKIYYTVRELTNRAPELWALRRLGGEVFADGPGGGHSWLQEHFGSHYITGWVVPELKDIAIVTSGISRWHNYYVEGMDWLARNAAIDGIYLDDVAFDRITMQRIRRVLERNRPHPLIDLHSANQYNPNDGFASSANLYLEHFPYLDRLWFGEYFHYDSTPPDYWLVELSGIPYGLMGEMLEGGGNPWRGAVFGMTNRLPWTGGDPRAIWKAWDEFGIADARMIGWWVRGGPVRTDRPDVLATTYLKKGRALVAVASWARDTVNVTLQFDWRALGIDARRARITAPAIDKFQPAANFRPGEPIRLAPGRGVQLIVDTGPP